jgi:hypothetical protein
LEEGLNVGLRMEAQVGIPELASVTTEASMNLELRSHQTWTTTENLTYSVTQELTVPADTCVHAEGYVDWAENVKTPYTMNLRVRATADGIALNADQLKGALTEAGFDGKVVDEGENELLVALRGAFTGSYGVNTRLEVKDC